jgi:hypothetical protein
LVLAATGLPDPELLQAAAARLRATAAAMILGVLDLRGHAMVATSWATG